MNWDVDELATAAVARLAGKRTAASQAPDANSHGKPCGIQLGAPEIRPAKTVPEPQASSLPFPEFRSRGPEPEWLPAMVRHLFLDGVPIEQARTTAQLAAAMAFEPKLGRPTEGPRIVARKERKKGGRRMAYVMYRRRPVSLGVVLGPKEDARKNAGAIAAFVRWTDKKCRIITQTLLARDWTLGKIFDWYEKNFDPAGKDDAGTPAIFARRKADPEQPTMFARRKGHIVNLREMMGEQLFIDVKSSSAERYVIERCNREIRGWKKPGPDGKRRFYKPSTAARDADTLIHVLTLFCDDLGYDHKIIRRPDVPKEEARWLTWDQFLRLLRACRGRVFDRAGKLVGRHEKRAQYECVERLLWLLLYGGTREGNGRFLTYGQMTNAPGKKPRGHLDPARGRLQRQGPGARVSNKRRGTSGTFGSLETLSVGWKNGDLLKRKSLGAEAGMRYVNVIHDEQGDEVSRGILDKRLAEVCEFAGLDKISTHAAKHTGVTLVSMAGMPLSLVEQNFSTSVLTLVMTYRHLHGEWFDPNPKPYDPKHMLFLALRKRSPPSFEQVYGIAPPAAA